MEILKSIDWSQVGPFTALLLIFAVIMLGLAPLYFKYLGKRSDLEDTQNKALIKLVADNNECVNKLSVGVEKLTSGVDRLTDSLDAMENRFSKRLDRLENEIRDKRSGEILAAIKRESLPSSPQ